MRKSDGVRVHRERKSDGVRNHNQKEHGGRVTMRKRAIG